MRTTDSDLLDVLQPLLREFSTEIATRLTVLERRVPVAGTDGRDGVDGKDAAPITKAQIVDALQSMPELFDAAVKSYLQAHPPAAGRDGAQGDHGKDGAPGPAGPPGLRGEPGVIGPAGPPGVDGAAGRDGRDGQVGPVGERGFDGVDGKDGLGLDDLDVVQGADLRTFTFTWACGAKAKARTFRLPVPIYRGVYESGRAYQQGDTVTKGGAMWHANVDTTDTPGDGQTAWTLSVQRGREGKSGPQGEKGVAGQHGKDGRDLTQLGTDGRKW